MSKVMSARRSRGFTLFELMVVLVLLMFVIGLLLPLVQAVRTAAARMESSNNLKQITLGLHACHDTYKKLPPAIGFFPANNVPANYLEQKPAVHGTVFYHILPFIEQANVYNTTTGMSRNAKDVVIQIYLAPADFTVSPNSFTADHQGVISYGANGYVLGGDTYEKMGKGSYFSKINMAQISAQDGASNTIAFAERFATCVATLSGGKETMYQHAWSEDGKDRSPFSPVVWKHDLPPQFGVTMKPGPDDPQGKKSCNPEAVQAFYHSGLQVALFDGSVRMVTPKISPQTWSNAIRHDDGQPLGADW